MKRIIIDYKKLTPEILTLLTQKFPDGYGDDDIITFNNQHNETIEAVEVRTEDSIYLVKIGSKLKYSMVNFITEDEDDESSPLNEDLVIDKVKPVSDADIPEIQFDEEE